MQSTCLRYRTNECELRRHESYRNTGTNMNSTANVAVALASSLLVLLPISVSGHHSMAEFDRSVVTELEGEVLNVSWRNPHILLDV